MNTTKKAKVIKTGKLIEVYKLRNGNWCDFSDCKTQYKEEELEILQVK